MTVAPRWRNRPPGSNWGDWGPNDQCGRLNLITPKKVLQGIAEVREGRSFCLSLPLNLPGGDYHLLNRTTPKLQAVRGGNFWVYNHRPDPVCTDVWCDDTVLLATQRSTQWDALCHVGSAFDAGNGEQALYYNGFRAGTDVPHPDARTGAVGAIALGIENMAARAVQGRGVMIDLYPIGGPKRVLVGYDALMRCCEVSRVEVEQGDMVCMHTGLAAALSTLGPSPDRDVLENSHAVLDGRDKRLLQWISDSGLAVLIADNFAVEAVPARADPAARVAEPLHEHCIFKLGIHLGELWHLSELNAWLKAHRRTRFLLTAPPLRLPGAAGSPVTPVATV